MICFYCRRTVQAAAAVTVRQRPNPDILHRYHPGCYAKLTEPVAQMNLEYEATLKAMKESLHASTYL